jgi:starch phosphorylase
MKSVHVFELTKVPKIAYFSMEIGIQNNIPTYSGGLGVLAGDTIKTSADLKLPMIAVTILSKKGYFKQRLNATGKQEEYPVIWNPSQYMTLLPTKITVKVEERNVVVQAWQLNVTSLTGGLVPVLFLDTDLEENDPDGREITSFLYGGDKAYRLKQEIVLGIGGVRMLHTLGFEIKKYHMNEGHSSLLTIELLNKFKRPIENVWDERFVWNVERVQNLCVFTTHTPEAAGHDRFPYDLVRRILGEVIPLNVLKELGGKDKLNMTRLGLNLSKFINGVAKKHGEVSRKMFPGYEISTITNGIHSYTWTCESFKKLYDKYLPSWANEPELFVRVDRIPDSELWDAHLKAKKTLLDYVEKTTGIKMSSDILTIGFARRATAYKRADLLFTDIDRLEKIGTQNIQFVFAGKAHPRDKPGKEMIEKLFTIKARLAGKIKMAYLQNYDMDSALKMVSGVDIWLNTPLRPREASGTSGMKAAHNGVVNFSTLDGWWIEGHIEGSTGWSIGPSHMETRPGENTDIIDVNDLYNKLESDIIPLFYKDKHRWIEMMKNAIGKNAYYFNSHRMMRRYVTEAYL